MNTVIAKSMARFELRNVQRCASASISYGAFFVSVRFPWRVARGAFGPPVAFGPVYQPRAARLFYCVAKKADLFNPHQKEIRYV